jgi:AcrR family transcriptional regulator
MVQNAILNSGDEAAGDVAERIAQRSNSKRNASYASEVRRLLDAGLAVMQECGTASRPRVSDIVAAAGLSNEAFYRHFPSKDALVSAILEDGAERLRSYLAHQMEKETAPDRKVRRWVEGVMAQAVDRDVASTTLAVLWNAGSIEGGHSSLNAPLAALLREPFADLGSTDPALDASLVAYAVIGTLSDHLRQGGRPARRVIDHLVTFAVAVP